VTGQSGTTTVTVTAAPPPPPPAAHVAVTPSSVTVPDGQTTTLTAVVEDALGNPITGRPIQWQTDSPAVAMVDSNGVVNAKKVGQATITATVDGVFGTSLVTVVE